MKFSELFPETPPFQTKFDEDYNVLVESFVDYSDMYSEIVNYIKEDTNLLSDRHIDEFRSIQNKLTKIFYETEYLYNTVRNLRHFEKQKKEHLDKKELEQ